MGIDQNIMKFAVALALMAAMAEANPWGYWGWGGYYGYPWGIKRGPKHEWVEGYGYAIPQVAKPAERKRREAEADPEPAVLGSQSSAPAVPLVAAPYAIGAVPEALLAHVPHGATFEHKGTEVIPGAVSEGEPIASVAYAGHYGYGYPHWGRKKRDPEAEAEADPAAWYGHYYGGYGGYRGYYGHRYGGYYGYPGYGYGYRYGWGK